MKAFACRLLGAGRCDISIVLATGVESLFKHLSELSSPFQYEIVKLTDSDTGIINLFFLKKCDKEVGEYWDIDDDHSVDRTDIINDLPDFFETRTRYRIEGDAFIKNGNPLRLIKLNKKEMPFG